VVGSAWFPLALAIVVTGLVLSFVAKPFWVPSGSMEATLEPGDRVLVNRLAYVGSAPATGDIIVFDAGPEWNIPSAATNPLKQIALWVGGVTGFGPTGEHTLIKRVIAGPGQTASCCSADGHVRVDGKAIDEPYVTNDFAFQPGVLDCTTNPASGRCFPEVTVPKDSYLVLGDNRPNSADSAFVCRLADTSGCWRWATRSEIVGKAVVILWPITRWRAL
jgi:signal peptidase I